MHTGPDTPPLCWRVNRTLPVLKLIGAGFLLALGVLFADGDPVRLGVASLAAIGLLGWAVRDLVAPVRLAIGTDGITVLRGFAGRRHIPWPAVERISVDTRPRLGLRTETLEIDTGDTLHLLTQYDLGTSPAEVATVLEAARLTGRSGL